MYCDDARHFGMLKIFKMANLTAILETSLLPYVLASISKTIISKRLILVSNPIIWHKAFLMVLFSTLSGVAFFSKWPI